MHVHGINCVHAARLFKLAWFGPVARMTAQETCQRERSTLVPATLGRLWVESEALGHTSSLSATGFSCRSSPPHACVQPLHQCGDARGSD